MKSSFITDFKVHQLLCWDSLFSFCLVGTLDDLALAPWRGNVSPCSCWHPWEQLSPRAGWPAALLHTQTCDFSWSKKNPSFYIPSFHSLQRGLPTTRALFTCHKPPVTAKLPTMSFGGSACWWCLGHNRRGCKNLAAFTTGQPGQLQNAFFCDLCYV